MRLLSDFPDRECAVDAGRAGSADDRLDVRRFGAAPDSRQEPYLVSGFLIGV